MLLFLDGKVKAKRAVFVKQKVEKSVELKKVVMVEN